MTKDGGAETSLTKEMDFVERMRVGLGRKDCLRICREFWLKPVEETLQDKGSSPGKDEVWDPN